MKFQKENSCFICHTCLHPFFLKTDVERHLQKKEACISNYVYLSSFEEIKNNSLGKRYYFLNDINPSKLEKSQLHHLIHNYHDKINIIESLSEVKDQYQKQSKEIKEYSIQDCVILIDNKKYYQCKGCLTIYKKRDSCLYHMINKDVCYKKKLENELK